MFLVLGFGLLLPWLFQRPWPLWPWWLALVLVVPAALYPPALLPLYKAWLPIARVLAWFNTRLLLGLVFFVMMLPLGIVLRLAGKLQYRHGFDKNRDTYRESSEPINVATDLERPF